MALSFTPKYHVEAEPGVWHQLLNTLTPFGRYPSMHELKRVSDEAATIESQGEKVISMKPYTQDFNNNDKVKDGPSTPFLQALAVGIAKVTGLLVCYFSAVQVLYAAGWGLMYLTLNTTDQLPATAWLLASDMNGICIGMGFVVLILFVLIFYCVGTVATLGGWRWPASLHELFGDK